VSLQTPRLTFRRLDAGDVDNLLALDGDHEVMRYLEARPRTRVEIETEVLPDFLSYYERYDDFGYWAGETIADGAFIGWFGMHPVVPSEQWIDVWPESPDDSSVVSLGYRLRRSAWGHGYATECTGALIRRAFAELGVQEVVATTMAVNTGSRRVLEKAGLRHTRTVHLEFDEPLPGHEHGDVEYRLTRAEWLRTQA
jgi:RimJ/RimL family protein N-acetyltransferase